MFGKPRNQRLPREAYRDPSRVTFFTIRATEETSPFVQVTHSQRGVSVEFHHDLCQSTLACLHDKKEDLDCDVLIACLMPDHMHVLAGIIHELFMEEAACREVTRSVSEGEP